MAGSHPIPANPLWGGAGSTPVADTDFSFSLLVVRGVAQLVERVLWEHEAAGSSPVTPTIFGLFFGFLGHVAQW